MALGECQSDIPLLPATATLPQRDEHKRVPNNLQFGFNWKELSPTKKNWLSDWHLGLVVGCGASGLALIINLSILLVAASRYGGFKNGIGTLAKGSPISMSRLSTSYHILINILSTVLLTSSNYCMQVLCSPTRDEIDAAHSKGQWLDIGVLSPHNLRFIRARRVLLWWILGLSSLPLHLLFNSAIFGVTIGREYSVSFVPSNSDAMDELKSTMKYLRNDDWKRVYDTQYVVDAGNAHLIVDKVSFGFHLSRNFSWDLVLPEPLSDGNDWSPWDPNIPVAINAFLNETRSFNLSNPRNIRQVYPISNYSQNKGSLPNFIWPELTVVNSAETNSIFEIPSMFGINTTTFWLQTAPIHIEYALVELVGDGSSVQIGLYFMIVVIISNLAKFLAILSTLKESSSLQLVTNGDAIASFLERPDMTTIGMCNLKREKIIHRIRGTQNIELAPWHLRRLYLIAAIGSDELLAFSITLIFATAILVVAMIFAMPNSIPLESLSKWGTASQLQLSFANSSFDPRSILLNAWLANTPQVILSAAYFLVNRICTSLCLAREWNRLAVVRKPLRVTNPRGDQRSTYFLSLPYRWAIPLTVVSGLLHWLLSQSVFLARLEIRDINRNLIPSQSRCACGYSPLSILYLVSRGLVSSLWSYISYFARWIEEFH